MSFVLLALFLYYEHCREARNQSVLMPMSMWRYPGARMGSVIALVFFAWYEFPSPLSQPHLITNAQMGFQYDDIPRYTLVRAILQIAARLWSQ